MKFSTDFPDTISGLIVFKTYLVIEMTSDLRTHSTKLIFRMEYL